MVDIDFVNSALDIVEGLVSGGLVGLGTYIIGGAVASLPSAFITASIVSPLSVIAGAMTFVGYGIAKVRTRIR